MEKQHQPILIVIAGPNGSGKTTITSKILRHQWLEDAVYVNPDNVAQDCFGDWNNGEAVLKAAQYCEEWRERCLAERQSLIFETVMSTAAKVDFIRRAKSSGYFVRLFFVGTSSPVINASRIANRGMKGGHAVPVEKIISRYTKSILNCRLVSLMVDRTYVYDNSVDDMEAQLLFRMTNGRMLKKYTEKIPDWAATIMG